MTTSHAFLDATARLGGRNMQTGIAVHDTDQEEGNAMNNNHNCGNNHKERQMTAITRTMPVAVLVVLGLALTAGAAEPAKAADTQSGPMPFTVKVTKVPADEAPEYMGRIRGMDCPFCAVKIEERALEQVVAFTYKLYANGDPRLLRARL